MTLANRPRNLPAIRDARRGQADYVPHLTQHDVRRLMDAAEAKTRGNVGARDALMIATMFDGCFRVSEALGLCPKDLVRSEDGWLACIIGKGNKAGESAVSASLVAQLQAYAYQNGIKPDERIFPITPQRAHKVMQDAFTLSGVRKPDHVGSCHVLRHSGALARLEQTGNPKAVQDQLHHIAADMTLRYMKTLTARESLAIQQGVDFGW